MVEWGRTSKEIDEEHDEDSVEEGFQLARVKFDRDGGVGKAGKSMKNMMRILLKRVFSWLGQNLTEMLRETGKL